MYQASSDGGGQLRLEFTVSLVVPSTY